MPLEFTLEAIGEVQIRRQFLRWGERAEAAEPLFESIIKDLRKVELAQFLTEGQHGSGGWKELKPETIAAKRRNEQLPWILRRTEALFKSLTGEGEGEIHEVTNNFLRWGTALPYASYHQTGTKNMPQRRVVQLTEPERRGIARSVQQFIVTGEVRGYTDV